MTVEATNGDRVENSVFVARRPVFNRDLELTAYELLVANGHGEGSDGHDVSDTVSRLVLEVAGDAGIASILGEQPAWLCLSAHSASQAVDANIGHQSVTIELRGDAGELEGLRDVIARLRSRGHSVAVEARPNAEGSAADLLHGADIAALDVAELDPGQMTSAVERLKAAGVSLAAANVDSQELHEAAHTAGFDMFRGEFFKKPHSRSSGEIAPSRLAVLRLLGALQDPDIELPQLAALLGQDVTLTYRLLRYINSAFFGMRREVTSIPHALALLGLRNVKRWATVMMLADVDHRPRELLTTALVRARFCELVGPHFKQSNSDQLFTLGLFSVLDALMDTQMARALRPLPLGEEMVGALTLRTGAHGKVLDCALAAERGEHCRGVPVDGGEIAELYRQCMEWGTESAREL
jgi:EAL and modified HD-GYP domain-containing signal transduction protein